MAHTKAGGSTHNGRDSAGRRLGAKLADGQFTLAGGIIYRQRGTKIFAGHNVGMGKDHTLYSLVDGIVKYETRRNRKYASVYEVKENN
ncbi:50S ribosomal protein L27 [[Mycoplasma] gypis]|uniref:Large ribosomal subunit protein bL27 n=1 Tax=[Mycoplasma] gypis TaxID=92404 RepID=A0ABZ2RQ74_9BACT|nr:50S ribosomal protein L27 [[Mycoplasma] gypis]MBN0919368.1 50S ribosomal protein L27 [[Mycoplasma] gypis]